MSCAKPQDGGFRRALSRFKANLSEKDQTDFEFTDLGNVYETIDRIQKQQEKSKTLCNLKRLGPFLDAMSQFGKVLDTFANSSQYVAFVWGPLKLLLLTARVWKDAFDSLLEAYEEIAENIPQLELYATLFNHDSHMRKVLEMIYEDILEFHRRALRFFRLGNLKIFFRASWNGFGSQFKFLIANLERHKHLVESQASLSEYQNAKDARLLAEAKFVQSEKDEKKKQQRMIVEWLSPAEVESDLENARSFRGESKDSGQWVFKDKKVSALCDPNASAVQSLWLVGIPGAGKTVLASTIIDEIQSVLSVAVAYFFCKDKDPHRNNFKAVLRGLVVQLLHQEPDILPYVYERCTSSGEVTLESHTTLKDLFENLLLVSKGLFIILDGIDECDRGEPAKIINYLKAAVVSIEERGGNIPKTLYISRDEGDIRKLLSKGPTRFITPQDNGQDIKQYTTLKSAEVQEKFKIDDTSRKRIVSMVCDQADGMFLYAYLVMINLLDQTTSQELTDELSPEYFPKGLGQAYRRIATRVLRNPNDAERKQAQKIMGWILCAMRPLKWHEIQGATSIDLARKEVDFERHRVRMSIKDLCGSLIVVDSQDKIEVVHSTARHYLVEQGHFDLIEEHRRLTSLSLQYLVLGCFEAKLTDAEMRNFVTQGYYSFMEYALQNWVKHIESCASALRTGDASLFAELTDLLEAFLSRHWIGPDPILKSSSGVSRAAQPFKEHRVFEKLILVLQKTSTPSAASRDSNESAVLDLDGILLRVRLLIEEIAAENVGAESATRFGQYYGVNLFKCPKKECEHFTDGFTDTTSRQRHLKKHDRPFFCPNMGCHYADLGFRSLRELNDHTARSHRSEDPSETDFPAPDPGRTDPFESISKGNFVALEDFLISEPEVEGRSKGRANIARGSKTLLKHAVEKQRVEAVEILLKHGAKPDDTGQGSSVTPLYIACEKGFETVVRLLIDHRAMLNYSTSRGLVPLHRASSFGHTGCVQALVNRGAPISDTDHSGHQSLYLAMEHKHFETASALIELGAELLPVVHLLVEDEYRELRNSAIDRLGLAGTLGPVLLREAIDKDLTELACSLLEKGVDPELPYLQLSLPIATSKGNIALTTKLLEKGANPNRPTPAPTSDDRPITMAIRKNNFRIAKVLLESGAKLKDYDILPAHLQIPTDESTGREETFEMIALLLAYGLDLDKIPLTFLELRTSRMSLFSDPEVLKLIAAVGQKLEFKFEDGKTILHIASKLGYDKTLKALLDSGLDVNTTCDHDRGALHYAVEEGHMATADLLLEHHIDIEIRDSKGLTALWLAFEKDDMDMAVNLLRHGADSISPNGRAQDSLLHLAVHKDNPSAVRMLITEYSNPLSLNIRGWSPLHLAVTLGNREIIQLLIEETLGKSAQPSFTARDTMEKSLLHLSAQHGQHITFDLILPLGLDLEDADVNGCTPLHLAANEGREHTVEALLKHGAKINTQTLDGHTPLHFAVRKDDVDIVATLLRHDADPNIPKRHGWMPLHSAVENECEEITNLLKLNGAKVSAVTDDGFTVAKLASKNERAKTALSLGNLTPLLGGDLGTSSSVTPE